MASSARSAYHSAAASGTRGRQRKSVHKLARMTPRCHFGAFVYTVGLLRCRGQTRGRDSVHKSPKMASRCRFGAFVYTVALLRCCGQTWGRRSVHKWEDRASPRRIGAFVYTVATRVAIQIATRAASGGTSASTATAYRRRTLAGPFRLVGKTGSERVAPLPGWHLRRGVNLHEPLKSTKNGPTHYGVGPRTSLVDRQGFEPWTLGLRVPCSTS